MENIDFKKWYEWVSTFGGIGFLPKAPGTWASLATLPIAWGLNQISPFIYMGVTLFIVVLGVIASQAYENSVGEHDRSEIVIDEVAGQLITLLWIPNVVGFYLLGFLLFRFLDIWKPGPIGYLDRQVQGGAGVMADDILAGMIGGVFLQFLSQSQVWVPSALDFLQKNLR